MDMLKYVGLKSVEVPSDLVSKGIATSLCTLLHSSTALHSKCILF